MNLVTRKDGLVENAAKIGKSNSLTP